MNRQTYRLVFSRLRGMLVAVEETATGMGKAGQGEAVVGQARTGGRRTLSRFALRHAAFAALLLLGAVPLLTPLTGEAQVVAAPGSGAKVIQTQNGLPQVNIARPAGSGVSLNTYSQFDVSKAGAILNNSPTIVQTQQAGYINGNPNFLPGQAASIIVNQVNSNSPSQLNGYIEVAGNKAEVVVANPSGLVIDGGGFINTSRAVLTTGSPLFGVNGNLTGFNVTGGQITVQGSGLNAANTDQIDLIARAVAVNAAIYANALNVVAGANQVDHTTLAATPIAGNGPPPAVSIDVSQLGGMYANRIFLASNENGVGVSNAGVIAAQAGDLTLTTSGQLVLTGKTNASGNMTLSAQDGVSNSGTTYGQGSVSIDTAGALTNSGTLAAQQNLTANAGSVASTGTLGAGINSDGSVAQSGDLTVVSGGALSATGNNAAGGNATLSGASLNLAGSQTSANGNIGLTATAGDLSLASATTTAGGGLSASASGALVNDGGALSSQGAMQLASASVSDVGGQIVSQSTLDVNTGGALSNRQGIIQAAGNETIGAASIDNSAGRIVSLGSGTLDVTASGALVNASGTAVTGATGGVIGDNGTLNVSAGTITNQGQFNAGGNATVQAQSLDNTGTIVAGGNLGATLTGTLSNENGTLSGAATTVSAASIDNSNGTIEGDTLAVSTPGNLVNRAGHLTQSGTTDQTVSAGGTLDNTGGTIASNATNLTVSAQAITDDTGSIQHAGTGTLAVTTPGVLSNVGGKIQTNGALDAQAGSINNSAGTLYGATGLTATTQGAFDNSSGSTQTTGNLSVNAGGALSNAGGTMSANGTSGTLDVSAASIDNASGKLTNSGDGATTVTAAAAITNSDGTLGGNGDVTVGAQTLTNDAGANLVAGGAANLNVTNSVNNAGGTIYGGTALNLNQPAATVINDGGKLEGGQDVSVQVASLSNAGGAINANQDITVSGAVSGDGAMTAGGNLSLAATGDYTNGAANSLHADGNMTVSSTGTLTNAGTLASAGTLTASGANVVNEAGAVINATSTTVSAGNTLTNAGTIEGNTVTTNSATLANTGTVIGNTVQVNATDVQNTGAAAALAAGQTLDIYASNSVTNSGGALIYSGGNLEIAKDGVRDATTGMLADQTGTLTNSGSDIEAGGDVDVAAQTINNIRTGVVTQAGTPVNTGSTTLTLWTAGIPINDLGSYQSSIYPQWSFNAGAIGAGAVGVLAQPLTVTLPASQVTNLNTTTKTFSLTTPLTDIYTDADSPTVQNCNNTCETDPVSQSRIITNNPTQYYNSITTNPNGTVSITFYPDYNPNVNINPTQVSVRTDLGTDGHDYVELSTTSTTTTATDQLVSAGTQGLIQAQGSMRMNANGGSINNESSTMAAGGDLVRQAVGGSVNDTGTVLQQTVTSDTQATYFWHQKTGSSTDTQVVNDGITQSTSTVDALPAIATANGAVQTIGETINVTSVNRVGQTVAGSGVAGGDATGTQLGSVGGTNAHPQTLGGIAGGIPGLKLPVNGLYTFQTSPGAQYLVATNPQLTSYTSFISSNYMLSALGLNPQTTEKRLGDGSYEEQLVMDQVTQLTGRTFLTGYSDNMDEYTALMNNGVTDAKAFDLTVGVALSASQMQQLTTDMVWLVSQTVTLPDGTQQTVLVPTLYLAQANTVDLQDSGALVAGNSVSLNATGNVNNSGHIVGDVATTVLGNNIVNSGVIGSGGTTAVAAVQDVTNDSGRIGGVNTVVSAGQDVINETAVSGVSTTLHNGGFTSSASSQGTLATGTISASNNAQVLAGRDVDLSGAAIQSGGSTFVGAGRNINVGTTTLTSTQDAGTNDGLNGGHTATTQNVGSTITTGGNLTTVSGGDTTLTDANVQAGGNASLIAANDLTVTAATDTRTHSEQSLGGSEVKYTSSSYDETAQGSNLNAGNNLTLGAGQTGTAAALLSTYHVSVASDAPTGGGNLSILGSSATTGSTQANGTTTGGATTLAATGDVTVGAVNEAHDSQSWKQTNHAGFLSSDKTTDTTSSQAVDSVGSTVSGNTVSASAGHDLTIAGSTVASTGDMSLSAGNNLNITTTQDTSQSSTFHEEQKSGFGGTGGAGISYGTNDTKDTTNDNSVTQNGSLVGSTNGSVTMTAGNTLHITGSQVIAAQDVTGTAATVTIDSATGTSHHDETQETKTSGLTLGLGGSIGDAINSAIQQSQDVSSGAGDSRAKALHGIAAAGDAATALAGATGGALAGSSPSISVELSYGTSQSKNTFTEDQTTQTGSTIQAGGTASFTATGGGSGAGTPGNGNVTIAGSSVSGNNVSLDAKNQVDLVNTTNTDITHSTNESSSASVGVSYGTQGWGVSASMSEAHGNANSNAAIQNNTNVTAANNVSIVSGGDTNIVGADVSGNHVSANVGGNLNIQSVQDTTVSTAQQSSTSGGFSISQGGGSASFSASNGHADSNYAAVNEQAGIQAGSGGFDINVKGNTNLTGAYIASTADASKNSLTTGTLTYSDIQNQSHYDATSNGFSAGAGVGSTGVATGPGSVGGSGGSGGVTPMMSQDANGDQSSTTRSAVSAGTINITDAANQTQNIASVNRDTSNLNGTVSKTPDVNNLLSAQSDTMNAAQAAGQTVSQGVGAYADMKQQAAASAGDAATAAAWAEGGGSRALLQAAGGALIGGLGGGSVFTAVGGAAGAGLSSKMALGLNDIAQGVESATGSALLGNVAGNVVAGLGGALVGGTAGATTASNVQLYNQQLDPMMQKKSLLSSVCAATNGPCSDSTIMTIVNAEGTNSQAALNTMSPNYATVGATSLSGTGSYSVNLYDGSTYLSGGVTQANPSSLSWKPGVSGTLGWIFGVSGAQGTSNFLGGDGSQAYVSIPTPLGFNVNGALAHSYSGGVAIELGAGMYGPLSYGIVPWSHTTQVTKPIY